MNKKQRETVKRIYRRNYRVILRLENLGFSRLFANEIVRGGYFEIKQDRFKCDVLIFTFCGERLENESYDEATRRHLEKLGVESRFADALVSYGATNYFENSELFQVAVPMNKHFTDIELHNAAKVIAYERGRRDAIVVYSPDILGDAARC